MSYFHHQLSSGVSTKTRYAPFPIIFSTSWIINIKNECCIGKYTNKYTRFQSSSQPEAILKKKKSIDLAVFGLVPRAWHAGLAQWAGWVWEVIPSRTVGAASVWGGEVCVPQVLSILTLGTRWEESFSLGLLHTHLRVSHPPPHLHTQRSNTLMVLRVTYSIS